MDLQTSTAAPSGSYAFLMNGTATQVGKTLPIAFGGIFTIDPSNQVSGLSDEIFARQLTANGAVLSSTSPIGVPDAFGAVTMNLTAGFGFNKHPVKFQVTGYIVDGSHIKLIESDVTATSPGFGVTGGVAIAQAAGSNGQFSNGSLSGTYVFGVTGIDLFGGNLTPSSLTSVGLFTADGTGKLNNTGFTDTFFLFNNVQNPAQQGAQISGAFDGSYAVDQTGRATLSPTGFAPPPPKRAYQPVLVFYLTDDTNPAPALVLDGEYQVAQNFYPSVGSGIAYPQSTAAPVFTGDYGFSFTQQNGSENDGTAQMNANAANMPAVSGIADASVGQDNGFLGTFNSPTSNFPFPGTLYADPNATNQNVFPLAPAPPMAIDYYLIDPEHGFFIETDLVNSTVPSGQVSFGYYAARTPLCTGCP
jgi:hypothetical protein